MILGDSIVVRARVTVTRWARQDHHYVLVNQEPQKRNEGWLYGVFGGMKSKQTVCLQDTLEYYPAHAEGGSEIVFFF